MALLHKNNQTDQNKDIRAGHDAGHTTAHDSDVMDITPCWLGYFALVVVGVCIVLTRLFAFAPVILCLPLCFVVFQHKLSVLRALKGQRIVVFIFSALIILCALSSFWSVNGDDSLEKTMKMLAVMVPSLFLFVMLGQYRIQILPRNPVAILAFCVLISAVAVIEFAFDFPLYRLVRGLSVDETVHSIVWNSGLTAMWVLFFPLLMRAFSLLDAQHDKRVFYLLFGILAAMSMYLLGVTASQSAQLVFVVGLLTAFVFPYKYKWSWRILGFALAAGMVGAPFIAIAVYGFMDDGFNFAEGSFLYKAAGVKRLEIWYFVAEKIMENPWYGFGVEATRSIAFDNPGRYWPSNTVLHPHNAALQLWLEFGIVGILFGTCVCLYILKRISGIVQNRLSCMVLGGYAAWFCVSMTSYGLWQGWFLGFSLLCCSFLISRGKLTV